MGVVFLGNPAPLGAIPEGDGRGADFPKKRGPFVLVDECQNVCRTWVEASGTVIRIVWAPLLCCTGINREFQVILLT